MKNYFINSEYIKNNEGGLEESNILIMSKTEGLKLKLTQEEALELYEEIGSYIF